MRIHGFIMSALALLAQVVWGDSSPGEREAPASCDEPARLRNAVYFTNWGIYGADFQPGQLPVKNITHVLYAFGGISENGTLISTDSYADVERNYPGDWWSENGTNAYGCVKQLYSLKQKNRHLKVVYSIGGWTASQAGHFARAAATAERRRTFAKSAVALMADWGFDGLDIDWEYPGNASEATQLVQLLEACRQELDGYARRNRQDYHYELSVASPAGRSHYGIMDLKAMDKVLDAWNLMAYDFAGTWDSTSDHQSSIFRDASNPQRTKFWDDQAVADYLAAGIPSDKVMLGLPLYGRSFASTTGPGAAYKAVGGGSVQQGVWLYRDLPRPGATEFNDDGIMAAWSYQTAGQAGQAGQTTSTQNPAAQAGGTPVHGPGTTTTTMSEFVTYDNPRSTKAKALYILRRRLRGAFYWEASGDKNGTDSLVATMAASLRHLDYSKNMLSYPESRYDNIRNGLANGSHGTTNA